METNTKSYTIQIRSKSQFYKLVKYFNEEFGHGKECWTFKSRVLRHLKKGKQVTTTLEVYNGDFEESDLLFNVLS